MRKIKHGLFIKNAAILTVTSLILRTVGIFFRVWLAAAVGAEGMGLYQLVLSFYVLCSTFASSGITVAVTRIIAELPFVGGSVKKTVRRAIQLSLLVAFATFATVTVAAEPISRIFICDSRAVLSIRLLGLGLPFMGVSACIKGYYYAVRNTAVPSEAQLIEQGARMALILPMVSLYSGDGVGACCAAIIVGDAAAEAVSCIYLLIRYGFDTKNIKNEKSRFAVTHKLLHIALPITAGRYLHTLLRTVENLIVPVYLARFSGDREYSLSMFGKLKGMVMPLLFFPASFLSAFSTLVIPEIGRAVSRGQYGKVNIACKKAIAFTVNISLPIAAIFFVCGDSIAEIMYSGENTGELVRALAPLVPFMYLESVCDGILKGLDQQTHTFAYSVVDSVSRIALIMLFVGGYGMNSFLLIMVYSNLLTSLLNLRRLLKVTKTHLSAMRFIVLPLGMCILSATVGGLAVNAADGNIAKAVFGTVAISGTYCLAYAFSGLGNGVKE